MKAFEEWFKNVHGIDCTYEGAFRAGLRHAAEIADIGVVDVSEHSCCDTCYAYDKMKDCAAAIRTAADEP